MYAAEKQPTCGELVRQRLDSRMADLRGIFKRMDHNFENVRERAYEEYNEYALSFDYVAPDTFNDQPQGYFRYQISWGGPSDEIRYYVNPGLSMYRAEYWYLDWFDGAPIELRGKDLEIAERIYNDFNDCGMIQHLLEQALEG